MYSMKRRTWPPLAEEARHGHDVLLVQAAPDDHVDLDRRQPAAWAASMPASTELTGKPTSFMRAKVCSSERIEADRDPLQPCVGERLSLAGEERSR